MRWSFKRSRFEEPFAYNESAYKNDDGTKESDWSLTPFTILLVDFVCLNQTKVYKLLLPELLSVWLNKSNNIDELSKEFRNKEDVELSLSSFKIFTDNTSSKWLSFFALSNNSPWNGGAYTYIFKMIRIIQSPYDRCNIDETDHETPLPLPHIKSINNNCGQISLMLISRHRLIHTKICMLCVNKLFQFLLKFNNLLEFTLRSLFLNYSS